MMAAALIGIYLLLPFLVTFVWSLCKRVGKEPPPPWYRCAPVLVLGAVLLGWPVWKA